MVDEPRVSAARWWRVCVVLVFLPGWRVLQQHWLIFFVLRRNPRPLTCRLYCCVVLPSHTLSQTINNPFRFFYSHCISGYLYSSSSSSSPWYIVIAVDDGDRTTVDCGVDIIAWRREGRNVNRSVGWSVGSSAKQQKKWEEEKEEEVNALAVSDVSFSRSLARPQFSAAKDDGSSI